MGTVIVIIVIAFVALLIVSKSANSITKSGQKMQNKDRCLACGSRLKAVRGKYATTCAKCGADQIPLREKAAAEKATKKAAPKGGA